MDKNEPALVPEWLRSGGSGGIAATGSANNQFISSSLQPDNHETSKYGRNKSSSSINDQHTGRSLTSDRTTSTYFRRNSSSNGSSHLRSYSSFGRSHRDRDWEKDVNDFHDNDKPVSGDYRHRDYSNHLASILPSRFDEKKLQHAQSMKAGKQSDMWLKKDASDSKSENKRNHANGDGILSGSNAGRSANNSTFNHNFPSLGTEERQSDSELGTFSSSGLSTSVMSLKSALIDGPGISGSSSTGTASSHKTANVSAPPVSPTLTTGLNMAETLAQGPPRPNTPSQTSVGPQRSEELAIKQSRQLIPMTPAMPKTLVPSPAEKLKLKIGQQHASHTASLILRGGPARSDVPKKSLGNLQVLKPSRELNGFSAITKDRSSHTNGSKVVNSKLSISPLAVGPAPLRTSVAEQKSSTYLRNVEKRPTSQVQSRNDFFNLIKRKSSMNSPSTVSYPGPMVSPSAFDSTDNLITEIEASLVGDSTSHNTHLVDLSAESCSEILHNGDSQNGSHTIFSNGERYSDADADALRYPDEKEEAAFLRSLEWDENGGEDGGLTEEEISDFFEKNKSGPSSALISRLLVKLNSQYSSCSNASSGSNSNSSDCKSGHSLLLGEL